MQFKLAATMVLAAAIGIGLTGCVSAQPVMALSFADVPGHWAAESIKKALDGQYVDGYPDGTFKPDRSVTRAEFVKMVATAMHLPVKPSQGKEAWYVPYVNSALEAGYHRAADFKAGDWNTPISRLEMSRMAVRASDAEFKKKEVQIDDRAVMFNATKKGLVQGLNKGELAPEGQTTRAQSVTIIDRILRKNAGEQLPTDKAAQSYAEVEMRGSNIETVWGARIKDLPIVHKINDNLEMTIHKMVVVDSKDPDAAFYDLYSKGLEEYKELPVFVGMYITFKNKAINTDTNFSPAQYIFLPKTMLAVSSREVLRSFKVNRDGEYTGWYSVRYSREWYDQVIKKDHPSLNLRVGDQTIWLNIQN